MGNTYFRRLHENVPNIGEVYEVEDNFDKIVALAPRDGILGLRDLAYTRIWGQFQNGEYVGKEGMSKEAIIYTPNKPTIIAIDSPLIKNPLHVMSAYLEGREFCVNSSEFEQIAQEDKDKHPLEKRVFYLPQDGEFRIDAQELTQNLPSNLIKKFQKERMTEEGILEVVEHFKPMLNNEFYMKKQSPSTQLAFSLLKDMAVPYALFNRNNIPFLTSSREFINSHNQSYARQLSFLGKDKFSAISGKELQFAKKKAFLAFKENYVY